MEVILKEDVEKLGKMGDVINVKDGYARNFLLPQGKALRATKENKELFEKERKALEAANKAKKDEAQKMALIIDKKDFTLIRQSGESGHLYGSVTSKDICAILKEKHDVIINRHAVSITHPIKVLGLHEIIITLHPGIKAAILLNVARSEEEAQAQKKAGIIVGREAKEEEKETIKTAQNASEKIEAPKSASPETSSETETGSDNKVTAAEA